MSPGDAQADEHPDVAALVAISHQVLDGIRAGDAAAVARHLSPDFVHRTETGVLTTRAGFVAGLAAATFRVETLAFESIAVDVFGDAAFVSGVQAGRVRLEDGQIVHTRSAFTDLFVKDGTSWLVQAATSVDL